MLDQINEQPLASRLLDCATINGAKSLGVAAGELVDGGYADFFTVDLDHPSIAGNSLEDLLPILIFGSASSAIRDVAVNGRLIIRDGKHELEEEIVTRYKEVYRKIWATGTAGATVPLDVEQGGSKRRIDVKSINRLDNLKLKSTL